MTPQDLKNSILQLAIQGKLVPQIESEGNAEDLYKEIQKEKQRLIAEKKIKKEKPLEPIKEEDIPFDIPSSWKWCRLGNISSVNGGYAFKSSDYSIEGMRVVRISDFNEEGFVNSKIVRHKYYDFLEPFLLREKDILLCMTGGTVGKSLFISSIPEPMVVNQRVGKISSIITSAEYINVLILSSLTQKVIQQSKNSTNDNISMDDILNFLFPLPPLEEQKRIVAKIEELLPLVERYGKAYERLEEFNKKFPGDMKKSILQMAIQGKLVEQRPEEGTAEELYELIQTEKARLIKEGKIKKEKPLTVITDEEKPFDIPDSWKYVRVGEIGSWASGATPSRTNQRYYGGNIPWLKTGDLTDGDITYIPEFITDLALEQTSVRLNPIGSVLMAMYGATIGKLGILKIEATTNQACCACIPYNGVFNKYVFYYLMAMRKNYIGMAEGGAQPNISKEKIVNSVIPLPPLEEQKRIVAKIEELLPLCERLKK